MRCLRMEPHQIECTHVLRHPVWVVLIVSPLPELIDALLSASSLIGVRENSVNAILIVSKSVLCGYSYGGDSREPGWPLYSLDATCL